MNELINGRMDGWMDGWMDGSVFNDNPVQSLHRLLDVKTFMAQ